MDETCYGAEDDTQCSISIIIAFYSLNIIYPEIKEGATRIYPGIFDCTHPHSLLH